MTLEQFSPLLCTLCIQNQNLVHLREALVDADINVGYAWTYREEFLSRF